MRLTQIKLAGFKSFVDPTTFSLASNRTGVVGPNGCGKSNVIDAVRWVTGESSARQLRGEALEDVIFNGSNARKPVGRASVELKFDNSEGKLGGQYAAFAEISVRRELTRDGGSKYFLNNTRARRRDVVDLFLGTGLGGRSNYAVIEQGAVNRLVEAKPEDMRQVLEEAAGISKYKERRRETENRMRHTRDNLERLDDLISEVTQRLGTLKRQAANAEKYKTLKADERRLRAELLTLRWQARSEEVASAERELRAAEDSLRDVMSHRRQAEQARNQAQSAQHDATNEVQNNQATFYDAQAQVGRIEQALSHAKEVEQMRQRERQALVERLDGLAERRDQDRLAEQERAQTIATHQREKDEAATALDRVRERVSEAETAATNAEAAWDEHNNREYNPVQQLDAERKRARYAQKQRDQLAERDAKRRAERERLPAIETETLEQAETDLASQSQVLSEQREQAVEVERQSEKRREEIARLEQQNTEQRTRLAELQAERAAEHTRQTAALREDDDTINAWLAEHEYGQAEGVARRIRVAPEWRTAAEAALGPWLGGFVVDTLDVDLARIDEWPGETVTLVEAESATVVHGSATRAFDLENCLADLIDAPPAVRAAAANLFVVDNLDEALARRDRLQAHQSFVTRQGFVVGPSCLITPAIEGNQSGVFEREQRIAELDRDIDTLSESLEAGDTALRTQRDELQQARQQQLELEERIGERQRQLETARAEFEGRRLRAEQTRRRDAEIVTELNDLASQYEQARGDAEAAEARVTTLETEATQFAQTRQNARERLAEARRLRDQVRSESATAERRLGELDRTLDQLASQRDNLVSRIDDTTNAHEEVSAQLAGFDAQTQASPEAETEYSASDLEAARQTQSTAERELRAARQALEERERALNETAQAAMTAEQAVETTREGLQQARVAVETAGVRRHGVVEQLEEWGQAPADIVETLPENASETAWNEHIEAIERKIGRLGAINLAAIEEYDEVAEREAYLGQQRADLSEALSTLEQAIAKIDRETRQRFKATYDQVNERFSQMFPQLFAGGEAALELTDEDWLATGVRVMARPPGKRNASIQMLSGGEKALTAVALLFALFELNPAPFCMLDEIDAPLDDANVSRFCELVRQMSTQVQFIVITHNKLTMELAEQLHGVTMAEPGVSRLVSVDIDQALDLAG